MIAIALSCGRGSGWRTSDHGAGREGASSGAHPAAPPCSRKSGDGHHRVTHDFGCGGRRSRIAMAVNCIAARPPRHGSSPLDASKPPPRAAVAPHSCQSPDRAAQNPSVPPPAPPVPCSAPLDQCPRARRDHGHHHPPTTIALDSPTAPPRHPAPRPPPPCNSLAPAPPRAARTVKLFPSHISLILPPPPAVSAPISHTNNAAPCPPRHARPTPSPHATRTPPNPPTRSPPRGRPAPCLRAARPSCRAFPIEAACHPPRTDNPTRRH